MQAAEGEERDFCVGIHFVLAQGVKPISFIQNQRKVTVLARKSIFWIVEAVGITSRTHSASETEFLKCMYYEAVICPL